LPRSTGLLTLTPMVAVGRGAEPRHGRILVVDDEAALVRAIARMLTTAGYEVATAADGMRAVDLVAQTPFDAIVSDIDMPRMTGIQFLKNVRQRDAEVPVILMTGNPDVESAVQAVAHGALQYLIKPVQMEELRKVVARAVSLNRMAKLKRDAFALVSDGVLGASDQLALGATFERALDSLWMAYQPIVRASDRTLFGYEALLRSEEKALPHPGAILDAAERLGRLHDLGRSVRAAACAPIAQAPPACLLFVNLHASDLMDDTLLSPESPLSAVANRVVLEITERASLEKVKDVKAKLMELRRMGFRIAIDDLGAGYAGLTSFATLEPEFVKLDMSLVRDVDRNHTKETLIRSMAAVCRELGMLVVAEGVETPQERELLVALGCDFLQGYLLAKPGRPFPNFVWP
jgi:EAL domain-containing protein (putative c-di-GMP-specific phosphodiesterase class I)/CheY-like chemotaxis protein